jgi:hypothetical protein
LIKILTCFSPFISLYYIERNKLKGQFKVATFQCQQRVDQNFIMMTVELSMASKTPRLFLQNSNYFSKKKQKEITYGGINYEVIVRSTNF